MNLQRAIDTAIAVRNNIGKVVVGKERPTDLLLVALFAGGHALLEDVPGTGKTLLAKTLARSVDCRMKRVQFTADLMPSDLTGIQVFHPGSGEFSFREGPVFTHILLADEINRATPRTQSSLLEAMEERQVTSEGETRVLERPFFVIATQNPLENQGTFPLPEAQLDRFMLRIRMGLPTTEEERLILRNFGGADPLAELSSAASRQDVLDVQDGVPDVHADDAVLDYLLELSARTRRHPEISGGASPRASLHLLRAARAMALLSGRDYVLPDDIQAVFGPVLEHRLILRSGWSEDGRQAERVIAQIVEETPVPSEALRA